MLLVLSSSHKKRFFHYIFYSAIFSLPLFHRFCDHISSFTINSWAFDRFGDISIGDIEESFPKHQVRTRCYHML